MKIKTTIYHIRNDIKKKPKLNCCTLQALNLEKKWTMAWIGIFMDLSTLHASKIILWKLFNSPKIVTTSWRIWCMNNWWAQFSLAMQYKNPSPVTPSWWVQFSLPMQCKNSSPFTSRNFQRTKGKCIKGLHTK